MRKGKILPVGNLLFKLLLTLQPDRKFITDKYHMVNCSILFYNLPMTKHVQTHAYFSNKLPDTKYTNVLIKLIC